MFPISMIIKLIKQVLVQARSIVVRLSWTIWKCLDFKARETLDGAQASH